MEAHPVVPVPGELYTWVEDQAAHEGLHPWELVGRALERERRRIMGEPQLDSRTKRPGVTGAAARVPAGFYSAATVAEWLGIEPAQLRRWDRHGFLEPARPGEPGSPIMYGDDQLVALSVLCSVWAMTAGALDAQTYTSLVRFVVEHPNLLDGTDKYLVVVETPNGHRVRACTATGIGPAAHGAQAAVVVSLLSAHSRAQTLRARVA